MKLIAGVVGALLLMTATSAVASAEPDPDAWSRVDRYLDEYAEQNRIVGLAAAVMGPSGVEHEYLRGKDGAGESIASDTPFLIGSIAKTMTATIVMELESMGDLTLGDHVSDHIEFLPEGDPTIKQLLTHTAGFTSADGIAVADRSDNEPGAIRRAVESLEQSGTVGEYAYSSADFLVLGAIVESITGRPYGDVLVADLLEPLGMNDSAASKDAASDLPPGHRLWWGRAVSYDPAFDESGTPYGSVTSTLPDLEAYAIAQMRGDMIAAEVRDQMQRPWVDSSRDHYGLGWSVTDQSGERVVHHTGANPGYFAHVYLVPDRDMAVVILANTYSESRAMATGAEDIMRILDGESREPAGGDVVLIAIPWILAGLAALAIGSAVLSRRRSVRRSRRFVAAALALLIVATLWLLPGFFGFDLRAMRIWLPDAAWSLIAGLVTWGVASVLWLLPNRDRQTRGDEA